MIPKIQKAFKMSGVINFVSNLLVNTNEGPQYTVQKSIGNVQIRNYQPWVVAETIVNGDHQSVGNTAFRILAGYIFGSNEQKSKIQMTAPVNTQQVGEDQFCVQFYMPKQWTLNTLPKPLDSRITLKTVPERKVAVLKYNGGWSQDLYKQELEIIQKEMKTLGLKSKNQPIWARYNSPMAPGFLRTNEIMLEI